MSDGSTSARHPRVRVLDVVLVAMVALFTAAVSVYAYAKSDARYVSIEAGGHEWLYPLDTDAVVKVDGPLGETVVQIAGGVARISDSPCKDKICVAMGALDRPGAWAACLPNGVLVRIVGGRSDVDAISF